MNMNGREKRKRDQRDQATHGGRTIDNANGERKPKKPKQTDLRLTDATKRKGIG